MKILKEIMLSSAKLCLCDDGIIRMYLATNSLSDANETRLVLNAIRELSEGKKALLMSIEKTGVSVSDDAREYLFRKDIQFPISALALVPKTLSGNLVARTVFLIMNPPFPYKIFRNEDDATRWLLTHKENCKQR